MTPFRCAALVALEGRVIRRDPGLLVLLLVMPATLAVIVHPLMRLAVSALGGSGETGAQRAVAGMAVLFSFFVQGYEALAFYRDHGWRIWDRVRCSGVGPLELVLGKTAPYLAICLAQMTLLFVVGEPLLGLDIQGSLAALALVMAAWSMFVIAMGLLLVAYCSTIDRFMSISNLSAIILAGLGGALAPAALLPAWLQPLSKLTPTYWAMEGLLAAQAAGGRLETVLGPTAILLGFTSAALALYAFKFRLTDRKGSWSA